MAEPLIGFAGFWYFHDPPELELLYGLAPAHWGRGFATETAEALIQYGFDTLGWDVIQACTDAPNEASVRVMERLGLHFERRAMINGLDTLVYRLPRPTP
jgi:ribosomal-protein-alanine N-acetyltransferase